MAIARTRHTGQALADDDTTPLAVAGACLLWMLRLVVAPGSTLSGFRRWVISEYPVAPRTAAAPPPPDPAPPALRTQLRATANGRPSKQDLLIALAAQWYDLRTIALTHVSAIATGISAEVDLHAGTARRVLRAHVLALRSHADQPGAECG